MISQYSRPEDIDREFWQDISKAKYWLKKHTSGRSQLVKLMDDGGWDVFDMKREYSFSDPVYYTSPQTGNRWLTYLCSKNDGGFHMYIRTVLYFFTEQYMTIMLPITSIDEVDGEEQQVNGINIYTSHMFQRMADPDRLGVDMTDRINIIRNFTEYVATGWSDTRPPKDGERHTQIMLRTPASWIRGHTVKVGDRFVNIYRTFYTDRSMTPGQLRDVRTFRKFADEKMNKSNNGTAIQSPDNKQKQEKQ